MGVKLLTEHVHSACKIMQSTKKDNNQMFQAEWGGFVTEKTDSLSFFLSFHGMRVALLLLKAFSLLQD